MNWYDIEYMKTNRLPLIQGPAFCFDIPLSLIGDVLAVWLFSYCGKVQNERIDSRLRTQIKKDFYPTILNDG